MARSQKAWLITWDWVGDHAAVEDEIVAILRPKLSERIIGEIVQAFYAVHAYSPREMAAWSRRPRSNPYPAVWNGRHCTCGHNPQLSATYVKDLMIDVDPESGFETISYVLPPLYRWDSKSGTNVLVRGDLPKKLVRTRTGPPSSREIGRFRVNGQS